MRRPPPAPRSRVAVRPWHSLPAATIMEELGTSPDGLSEPEARSRLADAGQNQLRVAAGPRPLAVFLRQFRSPLIYVLLAAAVVSMFVGKRFDVGVILGIVLLNASLGFVQELRAAGAIAALQRLTSPHARVVRDGEIRDVPATEVVVGDVLALAAGDRVPADARVWRATELSLDESGLTGESVPAGKLATPVAGGNELPVGDRRNMAYMGTAVTTGRGRAVVIATGMATEMGQIAHGLTNTPAQTPIQRRLAAFSRRLGLLALLLIAIVLVLGILTGRPGGEMFYVAISLAVSAIPEGLPIVVSVLFAIGLTRMSRRQALIRRLPAVETLGSATVICSDKTGTLTRNEMTVRQVWLGQRGFTIEGEGYDPVGRVRAADQPVHPEDRPGLRWLGRCARMCNDALLVEEQRAWHVLGDPTEGALLVLAEKLAVHEDWERLQELPFSSERGWMATLHRSPTGELVAFAKGTPDRILGMATAWMDENGTVQPVHPHFRTQVEAAWETLAQDALRVLALGMVRQVAHEGAFSVDLLGERLIFLGLVGMVDPARPEAIEAVRRCQQAGIRVVMITGDHRTTAVAIARRLGLLRGDEVVRTIEGPTLERLSEDELFARVPELDLFARVSPAHKLRIVHALQRRGEIVAMTGDGVNDAPALAQADIGVAMGRTGIEVAKGAAAMILADDNFATIVAAVEEGRTIAGNLHKVIHYLLTTSASEIVIILGALLLGMPLPLAAVQILWINLVTDGLFDKALALEPAEPNVMQRPPRAPSWPLVSRRALVRILILAAITATGTLGAYAWELSRGGPLAHARTEAFMTLVAFQWFSACCYRSGSRPWWQLPLNPWMLGAMVLGVALQVAAVTWAPLQSVLGTTSLAPGEFMGSLLIGSSLLVLSETYKALRLLRRGERGATA